MKVLGIDPGFHRVGWAIVEGNASRQRLVDVGCLETNAKESLSERLLDIHEFLEQLFKEHKPDSVAVEEVYYFKNAKTVIGVSQARGVILLAIEQAKLPLFNYTPLQVKSTIAGYGKAQKPQVQLMVKTQLGLKAVPKPDDAADACAIALTHIFMGKMGRR
jgi:crossover junction endodeoxyribonuclease RuvC